MSFNHYNLVRWSQLVTCFTEKETEAQKGQVNSVISHSWYLCILGFMLSGSWYYEFNHYVIATFLPQLILY